LFVSRLEAVEWYVLVCWREISIVVFYK